MYTQLIFVHRMILQESPVFVTISGQSIQHRFLECPSIQISTGFGYFDYSREEAWKYCEESLVTLAEYSEKKNVKLLLEELKTTTTNVLITSKDIAEMLDQINSPAIVGMVDLDQMNYAGETLDDYLEIWEAGCSIYILMIEDIRYREMGFPNERIL